MIEIKDVSQWEFAKRLREKLQDDFNMQANTDRNHLYRNGQCDAIASLYDEIHTAINAFERGVDTAIRFIDDLGLGGDK